MARTAQIRGFDGVVVVSEDVRLPSGCEGKELSGEMARLRAENERLSGLMSGSRLVIRGGSLVLVRSRVLSDVPSPDGRKTRRFLHD